MRWYTRPESFRAAILSVNYPYSEDVVICTLAASGWDERITVAALDATSRAYGGAMTYPEMSPVRLAQALREVYAQASKPKAW